MKRSKSSSSSGNLQRLSQLNRTPAPVPSSKKISFRISSSSSALNIPINEIDFKIRLKTFFENSKNKKYLGFEITENKVQLIVKRPVEIESQTQIQICLVNIDLGKGEIQYLGENEKPLSLEEASLFLDNCEALIKLNDLVRDKNNEKFLSVEKKISKEGKGEKAKEVNYFKFNYSPDNRIFEANLSVEYPIEREYTLNKYQKIYNFALQRIEVRKLEELVIKLIDAPDNKEWIIKKSLPNNEHIYQIPLQDYNDTKILIHYNPNDPQKKLKIFDYKKSQYATLARAGSDDKERGYDLQTIISLNILLQQKLEIAQLLKGENHDFLVTNNPVDENGELYQEGNGTKWILFNIGDKGSFGDKGKILYDGKLGFRYFKKLKDSYKKGEYVEMPNSKVGEVLESCKKVIEDRKQALKDLASVIIDPENKAVKNQRFLNIQKYKDDNNYYKFNLEIGSNKHEFLIKNDGSELQELIKGERLNISHDSFYILERVLKKLEKLKIKTPNVKVERKNGGETKDSNVESPIPQTPASKIDGDTGEEPKTPIFNKDLLKLPGSSGTGFATPSSQKDTEGEPKTPLLTLARPQTPLEDKADPETPRRQLFNVDGSSSQTPLTLGSLENEADIGEVQNKQATKSPFNNLRIVVSEAESRTNQSNLLSTPVAEGNNRAKQNLTKNAEKENKDQDLSNTQEIAELKKCQSIKEYIHSGDINSDKFELKDEVSEEEKQNLEKFKVGIDKNLIDPNPTTPYRGIGLKTRKVVLDEAKNTIGLEILDIFSQENNRFKQINIYQNFPTFKKDDYGHNPFNEALKSKLTITHVYQVVGENLKKIAINDLGGNEGIAAFFHNSEIIRFCTQDSQGQEYSYECDNRKNKTAIFAPDASKGTDENGKPSSFSTLSSMLDQDRNISQGDKKLGEEAIKSAIDFGAEKTKKLGDQKVAEEAVEDKPKQEELERENKGTPSTSYIPGSATTSPSTIVTGPRSVGQLEAKQQPTPKSARL